MCILPKVAKDAAGMDRTAAGSGGFSGCDPAGVVQPLRQRSVFEGRYAMPPVQKGGNERWK